MTTDVTEPTDRESFAPLVFLAYAPGSGRYGLILSDDHMGATAEAFDARGHQGGGYDWEAVARAAIQAREPRLAERVAYDCEAGMFAAYGTDAEALRSLGALLSEAHRDPAVLAAYLDAADPDWFD
ncbi:Imm51 family immunity protein [Streptomyces sp. NPDC057702]|uniref:Imm51 family immunity protein n=1 Tax=Streptomyces sp. NPDC057702 TaxID=3346221 RepID=UPI0036BC4EED